MIHSLADLLLRSTVYLQNRAQSDLLTNADAAATQDLQTIEQAAAYKPCRACPTCLEWSADPTASTAGLIADAVIATAANGASGRFDVYCGEWSETFATLARNVATNLRSADAYNGDGEGAQIAEIWDAEADRIDNAQQTAASVTEGGLLNPENAPDWLKWAFGLIAANELLKWWGRISR